jgi:FtsP/CotA-like multicopper oxidase with cupredoxin domain
MFPILVIVLCGPISGLAVRALLPRPRQRSLGRTTLLATAGSVVGATLGTLVGIAAGPEAVGLAVGAMLGGLGSTLLPRLSGTRPITLRIVGWTVATVLVLVTGLVGTAAWYLNDRTMTNVGELSFANRLAIPPLADSTVDDQGRRVFDLDIREGSRRFLDGQRTPTWGINGDYLGPTLRARRGEEVVINTDNQLPEMTTLHWHGMHLPAAMDGGPHQMVEQGDTWSPTWTIDQPAATLWYHPHPHGATADHVLRGVAGMFILDDDHTDQLDLPNDYGVDDIPVIVQDRRFDGDGSFAESAPLLSGVGFLGDEILVNGTHDPYQSVGTELMRLRLLNASNARFYNFGFTDDRAFWLVGTDSGLVEAPVEMERLQLAPGERAEIVVRFAPGDETVLRSFPADLDTDFFQQRTSGGDDTFDILQLRAADDLAPSADLADELVPYDPPSETDAATTRDFRLSGTDINGRDMDMDRIDEVVHVDTAEVWEVRNADGTPHNFHVHDVRFAVLSVDGEAPPAHLRGWKDTVQVLPGRTVRIIMAFSDYTDSSTPYMFHCHVLRHEDNGMMGQFVVVAQT